MTKLEEDNEDAEYRALTKTHIPVSLRANQSPYMISKDLCKEDGNYLTISVAEKIYKYNQTNLLWYNEKSKINVTDLSNLIQIILHDVLNNPLSIFGNEVFFVDKCSGGKYQLLKDFIIKDNGTGNGRLRTDGTKAYSSEYSRQKTYDRFQLKLPTVKRIMTGSRDGILKNWNLFDFEKNINPKTFQYDIEPRIDWHHLIVNNGNSNDKNGDPMQFLTSVEEWTLSRFVEFFLIAPVEAGDHASFHKATRHANLSSYDRKVWPWVIQLKENFEEICQEFDLDLDYDKFLKENGAYNG